MQDILEGLNEAQKEAVTTTEGFIRVIAGAGSGKTRALSRRFAWLVNEIGIRPGSILCVTFTNKAAAEMRQRIHTLTGDNDTGMINTFHGFCTNVLKEDSHAFSYPKNFAVLDNADIDQMLDGIYAERHLTLRDKTYAEARDLFEERKGALEPKYFLDLISMSSKNLYDKYMAAQNVDDILFYGYLYNEKKCFGLDYNDLIYLTLYLFESNQEIALKWQKRLEYIMIDEFQDIDRPQYQLMEILCGYHKNLFIVGDPDQTIYSWRGADPSFLLNFEQEHPSAKTILMLENYRSTPQILKASDSLIAHNGNRMPKELRPTRPDGPSVRFHHCRNQEEEGKWLAQELQKRHQEGIPYRDFTVLYRAHYVTRPVEEALIKAHIPYRIWSGVQFFSRVEIKDALAWLRMIVMMDDLSFTRIINKPRRSMGKSRMDFLKEYSHQHWMSLWDSLLANLDNPLFKGTGARSFAALIRKFHESYHSMAVSETLEKLLDESGYEKMLRTEGAQNRLDNLAELKQEVRNYEISSEEETNLEGYLNEAAFFTNADMDSEKDEVTLMTCHAAKGLEFAHVYLLSMNEGIFPGRKIRSRQGMEEERRLCYVAMTRAKDSLVLSDAAGSSFDNRPRYVSRFVLDVDPQYLALDEALPEGLLDASREYIGFMEENLSGTREEAAFHAGDRVMHRIFGEGTVESVSSSEAVAVVKFDSLESARGIAWKVLKKAGSDGIS